MSWKPYPKISQAPKLRSQVLKTMSWKPYPKISQAPKSAELGLVSLLWRLGPAAPQPPGVPGRARSSFCDGPKLRHRQTDVVNLYIRYKTSGCPWPKATVKPPVWNPGPKIEIPHPENQVLKVFRFRSWKLRMWKSRPQSWDLKSWKPCLENHILKFPRPQSWDPKSWKPCLENHILKFPRLERVPGRSVARHGGCRAGPGRPSVTDPARHPPQRATDRPGVSGRARSAFCDGPSPTPPQPPGVPGRARPSLCDGPELRHRQT